MVFIARTHVYYKTRFLSRNIMCTELNYHDGVVPPEMVLYDVLLFIIYTMYDRCFIIMFNTSKRKLLYIPSITSSVPKDFLVKSGQVVLYTDTCNL